MGAAVPKPSFESVDLALADTQHADNQQHLETEPTTRRSIHAEPAAHKAKEITVYHQQIVSPGWLYRLRLAICAWLDPRNRVMVAAERRIIDDAIGAYCAERLWHWSGEREHLTAWKERQMAMERNTACLLGAIEAEGMSGEKVVR